MGHGRQRAGGGVAWGELVRADGLDPADVAEILTLAHAAADADGAAALAEDSLLRLRRAADPRIVHLMAREPTGGLLGYAQLTLGETVAGENPAPAAGVEAVVEAVVHPMSRRRGVGRALIEAAVDAAAGRPLRAWAHGEHPSAAALALDLGFERVRVLWQLRRPLRPPLPDAALPGAAPLDVALPAGVSLRAFRPGADDAAWVELNRRAFADHPEQGRWTLADLRVRMSEPWFDPAGFLLAVEEGTGRLLGFHWTKEHRTGERADGTTRPIGEVYVLGVDPSTHGLGLGRALTAAGLRHLHARGLDRVMLYVDESNRAAMGLYARLGFERWSAHVQFRRPGMVTAV